jgi:hypothetical protein
MSALKSSELARRDSSMELVFADLKGLPRPSALSVGDRLTTTDFLAIVNEPIPDF